MSKNTLKRRQTTRQRTDGKTEDKDRKVIKRKQLNINVMQMTYNQISTAS